MTTHPVVAAPWQLGRSLELILLPLVPEPRLCPLVDAGLTDKKWWILDAEKMLAFAEDMSSAEIVERLARYGLLSFQPGDRIFLQEPWCEVDGQYFTQSITPEAEHLGWQPAHTMPEAAATHWYEIEEVRVCQGASISQAEYVKSGLLELTEITDPLDLVERCRTSASRWKAAHPDHPWQGDRYIVALQVKSAILDISK